MSGKLIASLAALVRVTGLYANPLQAEQAAPAAKKASTDKMISLAEAEPVIFYGFRRYSKFYGDENTRHGGLLERSQLLGSVGGVRGTLVDHGVYWKSPLFSFQLAVPLKNRQPAT